MMKLFCCFERKDANEDVNKDVKETNEIIRWEDTDQFVPPIVGGQVIKVYDGDTITIAAKLPYIESPLYRFSVRLNGIDTPEIKGKSEDEITVAKEAKDELSKMILHKYVTLRETKTEKYGRILAEVYIGEVHINKWMIDQRFAVEYDGGTKKSPDSWMRYRMVGEIHPLLGKVEQN